MTECTDLDSLLQAAAGAPSLPDALDRRTLALARAHLAPSPAEPPSWWSRFADYTPSPILVPALLSSAAVAFAASAIVMLVRIQAS